MNHERMYRGDHSEHSDRRACEDFWYRGLFSHPEWSFYHRLLGRFPQAPGRRLEIKKVPDPDALIMVFILSMRMFLEQVKLIFSP